MFKMENKKSISHILIILVIFNIIPLYNCGVEAKKKTYFTCKGNKVEKILKNIPTFTRGNVANTKQKGYPEYNNVQDISNLLLKGIRNTINTFNINSKENAPIYFEKPSKYFDVDLATEGVTFKAIFPENFLSLRILYNIAQEFNESFTSSSFIDIQNHKNKKYNKIFHTKNNKYVIQNISKKEQEILSSILFDSFSHFCTFSNSLLPKYSGLYYIKQKSTEYYFVIIKNINAYNWNEQYFLNGTDRTAIKSNELQIIDFQFLDNNFIEQYPKGIKVSSQELKRIVQILENDTKFLATLNMISYNLVLQTCITYNYVNKLKVSSSANSNQHYKPIQMYDQGKKIIVHYGIIDTLTLYDLKNKIQNKIGCIPDDTVKDPNEYQKRFMQFITSKVFKSDLNTKYRRKL